MMYSSITTIQGHLATKYIIWAAESGWRIIVHDILDGVFLPRSQGVPSLPRSFLQPKYRKYVWKYIIYIYIYMICIYIMFPTNRGTHQDYTLHFTFTQYIHNIYIYM